MEKNLCCQCHNSVYVDGGRARQIALKSPGVVLYCLKRHCYMPKDRIVGLCPSVAWEDVNKLCAGIWEPRNVREIVDVR